MTRASGNPSPASPDGAIDGAIRFSCRVTVRAKQTGWGQRHAGLPSIRLAAPPVDGKANAALKRFLGTEFATAISHVHIERGTHSRTKTVRIEHIGRIPPQLNDAGP